MAIAFARERKLFVAVRKERKMKNAKRPVMQTTLGSLIAVLCDETWPLLKNDRDVSMVVGYILNDLMSRNRVNRIGVGRNHAARHREERKRDNHENCLSRKGIDSHRLA